MTTQYLNVKDVAMIHFLVMKKFGEGEKAGVKDVGLLESAVHRPQQSAFVEDAYPSFFGKTAALFELLVKNHCFYNGNKRTAFASVDIFLKKNGYKLQQNDQENEDFTVLVAQGEVDAPEIMQWLEENTEVYQ